MSPPSIALVALTSPPLVETVVKWIQDEWPSDRNDEAVRNRVYGDGAPDRLPSAIVALAGQRAVGFVSIVEWAEGIPHGRPHWIDAVYVIPEARGAGLACRLIAAAEARARVLGLRQLFALTEIPALYRRCDWFVAEERKSTPGDFFMTKRLVP